MSDEEVRAAIEQMEAWINDPLWEPGPEDLPRWNEGFLAAMARADKGPGWPELMQRAGVLGQQLEARANRLAVLRDQVKAELDAQGLGARALKGYRSVTQ